MALNPFFRARANRRELAAGAGIWRPRAFLMGTVTVLVALALAGCTGEALVGTQDPEDPGEEVPPPPPAGVDAGILSVEVAGLDASASSGGSVTATPTGDTPGDAATVDVPADGTIEWSTAVGSYEVEYTSPPGYGLDGGTSTQTVEVIESQTTDVSWEVRSIDTPPPPPPPSADCTMVVMGGESPQAAVEVAEPGDVICLNGTFDLSQGLDGGTVLARNALVLVRATRSGTPEQPIVLRNEPGAEARIVGDFNAPTNLYVFIDADNWQVVGLTFETGGIVIGVVENVDVIANTIRRPVFPEGNAGAIRTLGGTDAGARDILIEGNLIEDIYGCDSGPTAPCSPNSALPWDEVLDQHVAAWKKQGCDEAGNGLHVVRDNVFRRVPAPSNTKRVCSAPEEVHIVDNYTEDARWPGRCNTYPVVSSGNVFVRVAPAPNPDADNVCPLN